MRPVIVAGLTSDYLAAAIALLGRERVAEIITLDSLAAMVDEPVTTLELKVPDLSEFADVSIEKECTKPERPFFGQNTAQSWKRRKK